jgi:hypothetical protein
MKFASEASKLLTNKYVLYAVVFIAVANVLGYLVTNKVNAVVFFGLIAFLTSNFSKNMVVILLVALMATNLLMANKFTREGLEGMSESEEKGMHNEGEEEKEGMIKMKDVKKLFNKGKNNILPLQPKKKQDTFGNKHASKLSDAAPVNSDGGSRIDYTSTIEGAYDNLDKILGGEGITKLTGDTQKLMEQQQKLFESMQSMAPMIENAKGMLDGFNPEDLKGLAGIASSLTGAIKPAEEETK